MKKLIIILLAALTTTALCQEFNKAGRTSLQFLKIGIGARQAAMGEASIATITDINSVFWNPAAAAHIQGTEGAFNYTKWFADLNVQAGAIGINVDGVGTFALNAVTLDYGDLDEALVTSGSGSVDTRTGNTFSGKDLAIGATFAKSFTDKLSIGLNVKYIQEKLFIYTTSMWAFDVGSFYDTGWKGIRLAMSAQNFSSQARYLNTKEAEQQSFDLPIVYRIGFGIDLLGGQDLFLGGNPEQHKVTFNIDAVHTNDYAERLHFGFEYWAFGIFALRGGYRVNYEEGNLSAGFGINYSAGPVNFKLDYAYTQFDYLDSPHRFSLIMNF